jgi:hypothetical protein
MGVGATALRLLADDEADVELAGLEASDPR